MSGAAFRCRCGRFASVLGDAFARQFVRALVFRVPRMALNPMPVDLVARQGTLRDKGVDVTDVVDHGWCKSIYFKDPNGLQLEYCVLSGTLDDSLVEDRASEGWQALARR